MCVSETLVKLGLNLSKNLFRNNSIIHRDIKPENIIIRKRDGLPVLIDFEAVKETMGAMTRSNGSTVSSVVIGTRGFMAPEQSAGRTLFSSDLYALGLTMIYGLTGKYPMEFTNNPATGELDWDSSLPNIPAHLKTVLQKAIKMEVGQRYSTAQDMYLALHQSQSQTNTQDTVLVAPANNTGGMNSSSYNPTVVVSPSGQNISQGYYQPANQGNNNNIIVILLTAILVALGVSGGFFAMEQMRQNQAKLDGIEQEKAEEEQKLIEEQNSQGENIEFDSPDPPINNNPPIDNINNQLIRVIVMTNNPADEIIIKQLYPDAFRSNYQGQMVWQVGVFRIRQNAIQAEQTLINVGFNPILIPQN
ncbi:serine/threonine protein kinase [Cyanobacterium sp. IPPAS B-1200]|uniref:serine/threonine protein kinase n=1 Tax=Cyanobacterium sp. IPPAS B-1200 TaxID=1562720 RepID=UPI003D56C6B3